MFTPSRIISSSFYNASKCLNREIDILYCPKSYYKGCRKAIVDLPKAPDDKVCTEPCERRIKKKEGILHKIKLKVIEGGTNFGTPFKRLKCKSDEEVHKKEVPPKEKALAPLKTKPVPKVKPRSGMQVSVLGANTIIGQYVALLLKQCACIKKLRLYEAACSEGCGNRNLCQVVEDLKHINTNCHVQAFSCACCELERCLQNSDIVLILESCFVTQDMTFEQRFYHQAPIVKCYADAISTECPKAFIIVCATPIDCMVPLIAETLKETGWYNRNKLIGSMAVAEMRASTLAARALCLEPRYTRVPCVGGTEGEALVPLFSRAVEYFDFARNNVMLMTQAVRTASRAVTRVDEGTCCARSADLSEAHALAHLVTKVAHALLCHDVPRVSAFVETDPHQVISPARYIANRVELSGTGIINNLGLPKMTDFEVTTVNLALNELTFKLRMVDEWYAKYCSSSCRLDSSQHQFFIPKNYGRFDDCAYATFQSMSRQVLLSGDGIIKHFDLPPALSSLELQFISSTIPLTDCRIQMAKDWYTCHKNLNHHEVFNQKWNQQDFFKPRQYDHVVACKDTMSN